MRGPPHPLTSCPVFAKKTTVSCRCMSRRTGNPHTPNVNDGLPGGWQPERKRSFFSHAGATPDDDAAPTLTSGEAGVPTRPVPCPVVVFFANTGISQPVFRISLVGLTGWRAAERPRDSGISKSVFRICLVGLPGGGGRNKQAGVSDLPRGVATGVRAAGRPRDSGISKPVFRICLVGLPGGDGRPSGVPKEGGWTGCRATPE